MVDPATNPLHFFVVGLGIGLDEIRIDRHGRQFHGLQKRLSLDREQSVIVGTNQIRIKQFNAIAIPTASILNKL